MGFSHASLTLVYPYGYVCTEKYMFPGAYSLPSSQAALTGLCMLSKSFEDHG